MSYFHGGAPGLTVGDLIEPGHQRKRHDGCPWCEANAKAAEAGEGYDGHPGPTRRATRVYATTSRIYAKFHASLYGYGDLYRVEPVGEAGVSDEDIIPSIAAEGLRVVAVLDRAVRLSYSERRRMRREWADADRWAVGLAATIQNDLAQRSHR